MTTPDWPTCEQCTAVRAAGSNRCLNHLKPNELDQFLDGLGPGSDLDARGTIFDHQLLSRLLKAVKRRFGEADFTDARLIVRTAFGTVEFISRADFTGVEFETTEVFGPLLARDIILDKATFSKSLTIATTSHRTTCVGTNFAAGVSLRIECGLISANAAVFGASSTIMNSNRPWPTSDQWREGLPAARPTLISLQEIDASNLVLVDIDLSACRFAGAHRLDQLRLEGELRFGRPPDRWQTRRLMLIEEDFARHPDGTGAIGPERVAGLYRSLRKALEDSKNEAGAGDFYYGEMEMRRLAATTRRTEKLILWVYWLLSGYGQRAGRAMTALGVLVATVCVLLFTVGLPGAMVWTGARIDQALRIGTGAVVFRDAGQALTSAGNWTVMVARFAGPVLLALAVLAVRARVKR